MTIDNVFNENKRTENRVALVTGGGKGVGAGIVRVLCANGIRVCINYNSSEHNAHATLQTVEESGGEAFLYRADISDREHVNSMVEETVRRYGGIDILINNSAMQPNLFLDETDAEKFTWLWQINIGGYWRSLQLCLNYLRLSDCPRVINISSVHSKRPSVFDPCYAMTKAANRMFTREAALELARDGITINSIDLGACKIEQKTGSPPFRAYMLPQERLNPTFPQGDIIYPQDVGQLVLFLTSPEAQKITGAGIRLDGASMLV